MFPIIPFSNQEITAKVRALAREIGVSEALREWFVSALSVAVDRAWRREKVPERDMRADLKRLHKLAARLLAEFQAKDRTVRWIVGRLDGGEQGEGAMAYERLREELLVGPARQIWAVLNDAQDALKRPRGGQPKERRPDYHPKLEAFAEDVYRAALSAGHELTVYRNSVDEAGTFRDAICALKWIVPTTVVPAGYPGKQSVRDLKRIAERVRADIDWRTEERRQNDAERWDLDLDHKLMVPGGQSAANSRQ